MQKNLVLYAWATRDGLGWYPGIIRRFPGSNHNIHITPPRLGFLPGRFSFPGICCPPGSGNAAQRTRSASQDTTPAHDRPVYSVRLQEAVQAFFLAGLYRYCKPISAALQAFYGRWEAIPAGCTVSADVVPGPGNDTPGSVEDRFLTIFWPLFCGSEFEKNRARA
jgi:hypothetical protein